MKKTKELENEETSVSMDKILKIESLEDAKEFERVASGRKFCKKGTRVQDICEEEVENYICKTRGNLLLRWYLHRKMKKNKEKLLLESRVTSVIRALAVAYIEENDEIDEEIVTKNVKNIILAKTKEYGYQIGGFQAFVTSDVLIGAGLSSSAAFETLMGTILSYLFNDGKISPIEIAMIGQFAENVYFGKPCGLMDQMACSVGSLAHINFQNPTAPFVERIEFDLDAQGYSLCITDTKGSHADLTAEYAAIPEEMKKAAACLGKEVLGQVSKKEILANLPGIREKAGDRAALRAIHYVCENERVQKEVAALRENRFGEFLRLVKESGDSSYKYLQNVYVCHDVEHQNVSIALAISDMILGVQGANRVHGGGFAGTIQAFVPNDIVTLYKTEMEKVFGDGACDVLKIRKYGGIQVM